MTDEELEVKVDRVCDYFEESVIDGNTLKELPIPPIGMLTTDTEFDNLAGGIPQNHFSVLAAGTGVGKSMSSMLLACAYAQKYKVCYIALENDMAEDKDRISSKDFQYKDLKNLDYISLDCLDNSLSSFVYIAIRWLLRTKKYDLFIIDGLMLYLPDAKDGMSSYNIGNAVLGEIARICKKLSKTVLLTWQLSREAISKNFDELNDGDVATSIGVSRYAGHVYVLGRDKPTKKNDVVTFPTTKMKVCKIRVNKDPNKYHSGNEFEIQNYRGFYLKPKK